MRSVSPSDPVAGGNRRSETTASWVLRILWLVLPLAVGPAVAEGLSDAPGPVQTTASAGLWALWAVGLLATLVPRPLSLAGVRLGGPAAFATGVWAATTDLSPASMAGLVAGALVAGVSVSAPVGDRFVDGASYGDERRFLLRAPGPVVVLMAPLAWVVAVAGVVTGPLLVADGSLTAGIPACIVGLPAAGLAARATHQLGRRWVVLVPAGMVLHDHLAVADPTLIPRTQVSSVAPAATHTTATDLSQGAFGLALEVRCRNPLNMALRHGRRGSGAGSRTPVGAFLCTPARPDVLLAEAAARRLTSGAVPGQAASPPPTTSSPS